MARDERRLARAHVEPTVASLEVYAWDRPTVTVGYGQDAGGALDLAVLARDGVPVVRRPTGGRAVFHADEWTYGAVVSLHHPVLGGSLGSSCAAITAVLGRALRQAYGIECDPPGRGGRGARPAWGDACFARARGYELTVHGRKLVGSAQRRTARALLQQGSLLVGPGQERLARYARGGGHEARERALAEGAVTLEELLGARPEPGRLAESWRAAWETAAGAVAPAFPLTAPEAAPSLA